ncbi:MAG: Gfo/Idh/MocA family oxidoreductase [Clostridia bacterium]|nr:Gfo/Idh/MocA family oxidoreductase [Clostridia bacterium]
MIGFYEKDDALAEEYRKRFDLPRFATAEDLLNSNAEGVIVCSATSDHAEDMIRIANAKKHIFTEKVLALTDADCGRVEAAIRENGVSFTISLFQKYIGSRIAVKQIVDSGELGKINYMRFRNCHSGSVCDWLPLHFYNRSQCGGGAMIDLGAHGMYLTEWILGVPVSATSAFSVSCENATLKEKNRDGVEDNAVTVMRFENGAIAINETGFVSRYSPVVLEVYGENGYVRMEHDNVIKCTQGTNGQAETVNVGESFPAPIEQFLTGNILPGCSIREAKALTHMMTMAYKM